jgi:mannose-6-phosphate isomerase-like protein (cupin superfamily)
VTQSKPTEFDFVGVRMKLLLSGRETGSQFSLLENMSLGVSQTPVHIHANDDETLYVIEGEIEAVVAGQRYVVQAGETVFLPCGVPHQLMNFSGRSARYLLLCTPAGFENFVAEAGQVRPAGSQPASPSPEDIARLREAAPRFGITLLSGWGEAGQLKEVETSAVSSAKFPGRA